MAGLAVDLASLGSKLLRLLLVIVLAVLAIKVADILLPRLFRGVPGVARRHLEDSRARTLTSLLRSAVRYTVGAIATMMVLDLLGLDTRSLLGGVAIVGLAVGFGAQNLVRDVITGFFIIYERQYDIGDYVKVAGVAGVVEELGLRVTKLRDWSGEVHVVPNGLIDRTTNLSRAGSRALVEVSVAYEADLRQALSVLQAACDRAARELPSVVEGPRVLGVKELGASGVTIMVWALTKPLEHWAVERELLLRLKEALQEAGIEIPYPRMVVFGSQGRTRGEKGEQG